MITMMMMIIITCVCALISQELDESDADEETVEFDASATTGKTGSQR